MPSKVIYTSFVTKDSPYEEVLATRLLPSLKRWNLIYDIEKIPDFGNWQRNTSYKPKHILKMLEKHKKPIVFLDSDATIQRHPSLFWDIPEEYDIAVHYQDFMLQWRNTAQGNKFDLLSGTIMFRYNPLVLKLMKEWISRTQNSTQWEQRILDNILKVNTSIKVYKLPVTYCTVILHDGSTPKYIKEEDIVIKHWQASRKLKNRRNWKK